jgi:uncharacterized RDD family membrane protein YckC
MSDAKGPLREELYRGWFDWVTTNLGRDSKLAAIAATAATDAAEQGRGFNNAAEAARMAWAGAAGRYSNAPQPGDGPPQFTPPPASAQTAGVARYGYGSQQTYGGFWIRFVAFLIDAIIIAVPTSAINGAAAGVLSISTSTNQIPAAASAALAVLQLIFFLATVGYFVYFWSTSGSTPGMRLFKLRVVDADTGGAIGIGRALIRFLMWPVNSLACYIGWIWAAFDPRKQGWHDMVANSVVIQASKSRVSRWERERPT